MVHSFGLLRVVSAAIKDRQGAWLVVCRLCLEGVCTGQAVCQTCVSVHNKAHR